MKRTATRRAHARKPSSTAKLRKNGESAIDARSTVNAPVGIDLSRIVKPRAVWQWLAPGIAAYTPKFVETILNMALAGDHISQYELFRLMTDTWPVLRSCTEELVYGVTRRNLVYDPFTVEDEKPTSTAIAREKLVTNAMGNLRGGVTYSDDALIGTVKSIMDAWFKGMSVIEILWENIDHPQEGNIWAPYATAWAHPYNYAFTAEGAIGLTFPQAPTGYGTTNVPIPNLPTGYGSTTTPIKRNPGELVPFPPDKFLVCVHKVTSGVPVAGAMLRPLAWWWVAANFSSDWLLNFAQIFGLPFRWATYQPSAPIQTVNAITDMLANMGSAGWAAFPEGTKLELKEAQHAGGRWSPQSDVLERADAYARILILGQTLTGAQIASGRGGQAFGTVEAQLKQDRLDAACAFVAEVINEQLIPAILRMNYGDEDEPPKCRFLQETEGTYQDAERDQILVNIGTDIPISHIRQKYNIPEPIGDEDITHAPQKTPPASTPGPTGTRPIEPAEPSPSETPRQVQARVEVDNMEEFGRELLKIGTELTTKEE